MDNGFLDYDIKLILANVLLIELILGNLVNESLKHLRVLLFNAFKVTDRSSSYHLLNFKPST